jgi:hypothetical protein
MILQLVRREGLVAGSRFREHNRGPWPAIRDPNDLIAANARAGKPRCAKHPVES